MAVKRRTIGVIGLGNFGSTVATELQRFGNYVIGVDLNDQRVSNAMGSDLESSILSAINLKLLGVETIWAKAKTKTHHRILSKLGVDRVIHPEVEVGQHIAQVIHNPLVRDYVSLGNGYHVVNFRIPEALEGKSLETLSYGKKFDLRCLGVMRGTEYIGRDGLDCTLQRDDLLILLGQRTDLRSFAASL